MSVDNETKPVGKLDGEFNISADFPLPSMETWRRVAEESLKGASYEKKLLTQTVEGIQLEPLFTANHLEGILLEQLPGSGEYIRGTRAEGPLCGGWQLAQELAASGPKDVGRMARNAVQRGQNALVLPLHPAVRCGDLEQPDDTGREIWAHTLDDFSAMLKGIDLMKTPIHLDAGVNGLEVLAMLVARQQREGKPVADLKGTLLSDPLSLLGLTGRLALDLGRHFDKMALALNWTQSGCPGLRTVGVNGMMLREAGADVVTELAAMLSMGVFYLDEMVSRGLAVERIAKGMAFTAGIGPFFFMEIAKFRAMRALWSRIISAYGSDPQEGKVWVRAQTSTYEWTRYDRHVNLLRGTTEAFSAIVGGVDALTVSPFNRPGGEEDDFSRRISRNLQIVLKEESHLDRVIDPAGGSYYVEWLTRQLIDRAWKLFVEMDEAGGYLEELKAGRIQERIALSRQLRDKDLAKRKQLLVGINAYANVKEETPAHTLGEEDRVRQSRLSWLRREQKAEDLLIRETALKAMEDKGGDAVMPLVKGYLAGASLFALHLNDRSGTPLTVTPFRFSRLAEPFEALRDRSAARVKAGKGPVRVVLLPLGPMSEHKARADFSKAFLEVAGFEVVYPDALKSADAALALARESRADVAVICSLDDRYPEWVPALAQPLKAALPGVTVVLAGYPKEQVELYRQQGVDEFIYLGCDALKTLNTLFNNSEVK